MRTTAAIVFLLVLLVAVPFAHMQEDYPPLVVANTEQIPLTSETNGHDYVLNVALPNSYTSSDADQTYPVLYVLDPNITFLSVTEFMRFMTWAGELPELIVVGIDYPINTIAEGLPLRERDYYYARDAFLEFISAELFPLIDSRYRTNATDRGLIGFSYGGELVYHILVTNPAMFNRYIAIDAAQHELLPYLMRDDADFRDGFIGQDIKLFISEAGTELSSAAFQNRAYEGLTVTGLSLGNVTHAAALHHSLAPGIIAIYAE